MHTFMKIPTYTQTPGLDRYPKGEQFAVYRAMHKRLMREDIAYQRRFSSYLTTLIILVIIPVVGWAIAIYLAIRQQQFQNRRIGDVLQAVA
jgi:hypothetical protein